MRKTPVIVLAALMVAISIASVYAYNVALTIPADVTIDEHPQVIDTYWISNTTILHFGHIELGHTSDILNVTVTNDSGTAQTLHVSCSDAPANTTLIMNYKVGDTFYPYTPTIVGAHSSITLYFTLEVGELATPDAYTFHLGFDST